MYVESDSLSRLRADHAALAEEIERLETGSEPVAADRLYGLRKRLDRLQKEIDRLELAEEVGRQHDA